MTYIVAFATSYYLDVNMPSGIQLKCEDHGIRARTVFKLLAHDEEFTDVTLVSEDGKAVPTHRAILALSSPYFLTIFNKNKSERFIHTPVKSKYLKSMVEYIYLGETRVEPADVKEFLSIANKFQIPGLCFDESMKAKENKSSLIKNEMQFKLDDVDSPLETSHIIQDPHKDEAIVPKKSETLAKDIFETEPIKNATQESKILEVKHVNEKRTKKQKNRKILKPPNTRGKESRIIQCEDCGYIGTKNSLRQHKLIHTGVLQSCDKCSYSSVNPFHLKEHLRNVHDPVYLFCDKCTFRAKTKRYLQGHNEREHEGRIYMCDKCDFKSKFFGRFSDHMKGVHEGKKYSCDKCTYTSTFRAPLFHHKQVRHNNVKYACNYCSYVATRPDNLKLHERRLHG